jgi:phospholipase/carboxylesterase
MERITRRRFLGWSLAGAATACSGLRGSSLFAAEDNPARLRARPGTPTKPAKKGRHELGLAKGRDGMLSVPKGNTPENPVPLIVMLHGAGGRDGRYNDLSKLAAEEGMAMMVPDSRGQTWDFILGNFAPSAFGPDIEFLDRALEHTFGRVAVDPRRIALAGFSDGASYALSVGLANGDLFTHVIAFSPGFVKPPSRVGKPRVFVSHGTLDRVLPVSISRDQIVPRLKEWGHEVMYKEYDGGHSLDQNLSREAFRWMK